MSRLFLLALLISSIPVFAGNSGTSDPAAAFKAPTELDRLLDANPQPLPEIKDTVAVKNAVVFQVQLEALSDIDSAQARKASLEQTIGGKINLVFDPPYYKLRFGNFATKQEAEDALVDLAGKNIQGFIVRQ